MLGAFHQGIRVTVDGNAAFLRQEMLERTGHCFGDDDYRIFKAFQLCPVGNDLTVWKGKDIFKVGHFGHDLLEVAIDPF